LSSREAFADSLLPVKQILLHVYCTVEDSLGGEPLRAEPLQPATAVAAHGFAGDASDAGYLAPRGIALYQCVSGRALIGFQDLHHLALPQPWIKRHCTR